MSALLRVSTSSLRVVSRRPLANVRWSSNGAPEHLPFNYKNKAAFRLKYLAFIGFGFSLPFVAAGWQLKKSAGAA